MSAPEVGTRLPPFRTTVPLRQLVRYAGAAGDFYELHYDADAARALGHPDIALHGLLKAALLARVTTDWIGTAGTLTEFSASYRGMDYRDRPLTCHGTVVAVEGERVEIELRLEGDGGRTTTTGRAVARWHG